MGTINEQGGMNDKWTGHEGGHKQPHAQCDRPELTEDPISNGTEPSKAFNSTRYFTCTLAAAVEYDLLLDLPLLGQ